MNEYVMVYGHKISFLTRRPDPITGQPNPNMIGRTRINDPSNPGHTRQKDFSGKSKEEITAKAYHFFRQTEVDPRLPGVPLGFSAWADHCLDMMCRHREVTTAKSYHRLVNNLKAELQDTYLPLITSMMLQSIIDKLVAQGICASSVHKTYCLLNRIMKAAVNDGILAVNPAANLVLPRNRVHHNAILSVEEIKLLFRACSKDPYGNVFLTCLLCAFRIGEALGLCEDAIYEDTQSIRVYQQYRSETKSFEATKTKKERTIYPPVLAFEVIRRQIRLRDQYCLRYADRWHNERKLIFTNRFGEPLLSHTAEDHFKKIAASIGRPELHSHDLRRTAASIAMYLSNNPVAVKELLGHESLSMTYGYCSTTHEQMEEFAMKQDSFYHRLFNE